MYSIDDLETTDAATHAPALIEGLSMCISSLLPKIDDLETQLQTQVFLREAAELEISNLKENQQKG